jgi:acyl carrier protein
MLEKIIEIISEKLNLEAAGITKETRFKEDLGADSLDLFELIMALEDEYAIEIDQDALESLTTVGSVIDYLTEAGIEI